ncbi:hypothetical protein [Sphaerospermopsis reniformis]|uniref:hypothetical protein n=1 Tax=Sphaerospermopsis reniformis TaxID=531300 RepID=UPI0010FA55CF|nr:hypothetical protein [Sphaerospermopsis reniformis]
MGVVNLGGRREEVVSYSPQSPVPSHQSPVTSPLLINDTYAVSPEKKLWNLFMGAGRSLWDI